MRFFLSLVLSLAFAGSAFAQSLGDHAIHVAAGKSVLYEHPTTLARVTMANPAVAEVVTLSPQQVQINAKTVGSTTLMVWDAAGGHRTISVEVTVNSEGLENFFRNEFPDANIRVAALGSSVVLSGEVAHAGQIARAIEIAKAAGYTVISDLRSKAPSQVLLKVRFAEISRTAFKDFSSQFAHISERGVGAIGADKFKAEISDGFFQGTFSDAINLFLFSPDLDLSAFIRALQTGGHFRSLAEPNLIAMDGKEASFLAGGEFPIPVAQGVGGVAIVFKEFGVRLNFKPTLTPQGKIHLKVAPEVSSLDFANGLQSAGFQIPSILVRRAGTEVELMSGQTFAIAGLMDHSITDNLDRVPFLSDVPLLGKLFESKELRQRKTELLVLVTPVLLEATESVPSLPTGEPEDWNWEKSMGMPKLLGVPAPSARSGGQ